MITDDLKVVIVDDDDSYLHYATWALEEVGIQAVATTDCKQVGELIELHQPDLLILDKMMEIDGLELAEEALRDYPSLPVLIVSSTAYDCDRKRALTLGCIDYLRKDSDKSAFLDRVSKYCHLGHLTNALDKLESKWDKARNFINIKEERRVRKDDRRNKGRRKTDYVG